MNRLLRIVVLMTVLSLGLVMAGCSGSPALPPVQGFNVGDPAPDFRLQNLAGEEISLSDFRGKPVLINFWATWCGPCRDEMPFIQGVFEDKEWSDQGLVILAVNLGEPPAKVEEFMEEYGLTFPVLLDARQDAAKAYNVRGIPATFFIDKNGIIKDRQVGAFPSQAKIDWRLLNSIMGDE